MYVQSRGWELEVLNLNETELGGVKEAILAVNGAGAYNRLKYCLLYTSVVAIVVGKDEKCVEKAMKLIKVEYQVLEPVLDFHTAKDNPILCLLYTSRCV